MREASKEVVIDGSWCIMPTSVAPPPSC